MPSGITFIMRAFIAIELPLTLKNSLILGDLESALEKVKNDLSDMNLEFNAGGITLFQSVLGERGPTYTILKS